MGVARGRCDERRVGWGSLEVIVMRGSRRVEWLDVYIEVIVMRGGLGVGFVKLC